VTSTSPKPQSSLRKGFITGVSLGYFFSREFYQNSVTLGTNARENDNFFVDNIEKCTSGRLET